MPTDAFTTPGIWSDFFYELFLKVGPIDDARLEAGLRALWQYQGVDGPYLRKDVEPGEQRVLDPATSPIPLLGHMYGRVSIPGLPRMVCGSIGTAATDIDFSTDPPTDLQTGEHWLTFYVPGAALYESEPRMGSFPVGADGGEVSLAWRGRLDQWLAGLGRHIYEAVPFQLGVIGAEGWDEPTPDELLRTPDRYTKGQGFLVPTDEGLRYLPATS